MASNGYLHRILVTAALTQPGDGPLWPPGDQEMPVGQINNPVSPIIQVFAILFGALSDIQPSDFLPSLFNHTVSPN